MVIGNENYDFYEFEKVRFFLKFRGFVVLFFFFSYYLFLNLFNRIYY